MLQDITGEQGEYLLSSHEILHSRGYSVSVRSHAFTCVHMRSHAFTFNILHSDGLDMFIGVDVADHKSHQKSEVNCVVGRGAGPLPGTWWP